MLRQLCEDLSNARACVKHLKTEKHCAASLSTVSFFCGVFGNSSFRSYY